MTTRGLLILAVCLSLLIAVRPCEKGFTNTEFNSTCVDLDECAPDEDYEDELPQQCGENAICINTIGSFSCRCAEGFAPSEIFSPEMPATCKDINECWNNEDMCGPNAVCHNAIPFYSCICKEGFNASNGREEFHMNDIVTCNDIDECREIVCMQNALCVNTLGSYRCACKAGFILTSGKADSNGNQELCEDICVIDKTICGNGTCHQGANGHYCACHAGFTNYGNEKSRCTELSCDAFESGASLEQNLPEVQSVLRLLKNSCLNLSASEAPTDLNGEELLERLFSMTDRLLSGRPFNDNRKVSALLNIVESTLVLIGPFMRKFQTNSYTTHTELELLLQKGPVSPRGPVTLLSKHAKLQIQWETAAGKNSSYPGFTTASLLTYTNLEDSTNAFFSGVNRTKGQSLQINSKVVTVKVSNLETDVLQEPVVLTFYHLTQSNGRNHTCVYWESSEDGGRGAWSDRGCTVLDSAANYTVCSCNHLCSFAVLMALHEIEDPFELRLFTWVGLALSLVCLVVCILTFSLIRSIQSPRTTIHLHLCLSLFSADLVFLCGISRTENQTGCAVVAGLLHYLYLAAFCWMCLEGIQLFRMVILVFNTTFKTLYMMAVGYGVPAVIVAISAIVNSSGYGTKRHCWLNLENAFMWSFFGPVCVIITVNILFFLITVWKLAQKFSSLNPDLDNLRKIRAFTITAVAQLCVLGTMWIFGCFQFEKGPLAPSYLFTILNTLQGVLLFVMHCLLSKPVREEYGKIFSRFSVPQKKPYSELTSSQSSKAQTSKSIQNTGESHI